MIKSIIRKTLGNLISSYSDYSLVNKNHLVSLQSQTFDHHLGKMFNNLNIECVIDVGANTGGYHDFLRNQVEFQGIILSFEPLKKHVEILEELAKNDSNWYIFDFALGNEDNSKEMNLMKAATFSSFLTTDNSNVGTFTKFNVIEEKEIVKIRRLDSIFAQLKQKYSVQNIYLKMDTQGYDLEVIKGADNSLSEILALQTELSIISLYENMPIFTEVYQTLKNKKYSITGMFPVSRDKSLRIIEFDGVFINENPKA